VLQGNGKINMPHQQPPSITIPLPDLIWNILGDDSNGQMCGEITHTTALVLSHLLKDSFRWKVEFNDENGDPLKHPVLWRYAEWKSASTTRERAKVYAHNRVVEWRIKDKNEDLLIRAIRKTTGLTVEQARPIAMKVLSKGTDEVLALLGMAKRITKEEEL
jgi:hypothetical protein